MTKEVAIANPLEVESATAVWIFSFGAYGNQHVAVWKAPGISGLEDALELAAEWLAENAPGHLTAEEDMEALYKEAAEDYGVSWPPDDYDDPVVEQIRESAEADMTYTESGWLTSYEWTVNDGAFDQEQLDDLFERSVEIAEEEYDGLDEQEWDSINKAAKKLGAYNPFTE